MSKNQVAKLSKNSKDSHDSRHEVIDVVKNPVDEKQSSTHVQKLATSKGDSSKLDYSENTSDEESSSVEKLITPDSNSSTNINIVLDGNWPHL